MDGQDYKTLKANLLREGKLFEDPYFSCTPRSIRKDGNVPVNLRWRRPGVSTLHSSYMHQPPPLVWELNLSYINEVNFINSVAPIVTLSKWNLHSLNSIEVTRGCVAWPTRLGLFILSPSWWNRHTAEVLRKFQYIRSENWKLREGNVMAQKPRGAEAYKQMEQNWARSMIITLSNS